MNCDSQFRLETSGLNVCLPAGSHPFPSPSQNLAAKSDITGDVSTIFPLQLLTSFYNNELHRSGSDFYIAGDITFEDSQPAKEWSAGKLITLLRACRNQTGSSLIEISLLIPLIMLLIAGVLDLGRALYYTNVLTHAANASAIYGALDPADITGMENLAVADAGQVPGASAVASYGCECQDGSQKSANCSTVPACTDGSIYYVTVKTSADYTPMVHWPGMGSSFTLSSSSTMRGGE